MLVASLALLVGVLLVAGLALLVVSHAGREAAGLPAGRVIAADTGAWNRCERPLYSAHYHLVGRPDYLVRAGRHTIPVEVKPNRVAASPYVSDVLQLGAYCLLVEENHGRPPHGILRYRDRVFQVDYTDALRRDVLDALKLIRRDRTADGVKRSHDDPGRCRGCGVRSACDQRL